MNNAIGGLNIGSRHVRGRQIQRLAGQGVDLAIVIGGQIGSQHDAVGGVEGQEVVHEALQDGLVGGIEGGVGGHEPGLRGIGRRLGDAGRGHGLDELAVVRVGGQQFEHGHGRVTGEGRLGRGFGGRDLGRRGGFGRLGGRLVGRLGSRFFGGRGGLGRGRLLTTAAAGYQRKGAQQQHNN